MKVRISYTVDLTDDIRAGLENHYGRKFKSRREAADTLRYFCEGNGTGALDDLQFDLDLADEWARTKAAL